MTLQRQRTPLSVPLSLCVRFPFRSIFSVLILFYWINNNNNNNNNNDHHHRHYHHCHRGSKKDKLYLSENLCGNSERQHVVFHWVIHHRHGLNTNNNNIMIVMIIIILITRYSVLITLQWQKTPKSFSFSACVRFPLDFQCIFVVDTIIIIVIIIKKYNNNNNNNNNKIIALLSIAALFDQYAPYRLY